MIQCLDTERALIGCLLLPWKGQGDRVEHCRVGLDRDWFTDLTLRAVFDAILRVEGVVHSVKVLGVLRKDVLVAPVDIGFLLELEGGNYVPSCYADYAAVLKELHGKRVLQAVLLECLEGLESYSLTNLKKTLNKVA